MRATKGLRAMALILSASALLGLFSLFGCRKNEPDGEPVDGGTVTHTDPDAPKTVESKELTAFSAELFLSNRNAQGRGILFLYHKAEQAYNPHKKYRVQRPRLP